MRRNTCTLIIFVILSVLSTKYVSAQSINTSEDYFIEGVRYYNEDNLEKASTLFKQSIKKDQGNDAAYYYLSNIKSKEESYSDALLYISKALEIDPDNITYLRSQARLYEYTGEKEKAAQIYLSIIDKNPSSTRTYWELANIYLSENKYDKVTEIIDRVEAMKGVGEYTKRTRYEIYKMSGKGKEAMDLLQDLVKEYPSAQYSNELAYYYRERSDDSLATYYYNDALRLDPGFSFANLGLAELYRAKGEFGDFFKNAYIFMADPNVNQIVKCEYLQDYIFPSNLVALFTKQVDTVIINTITAHPTDSSVLTLASQYYAATGREGHAEGIIKRNIELHPENIRLKYNLLSFYMTFQKWDRLIDASEQVLKYYPDDYNVKEVIAVAHGQMGEYRKAIAQYEKLLSSLPKGHEAILNCYAALGDLYYETGTPSKAFRYYEKALKISPDNTHVLNNYAYFLGLKEKNLSKALKMSRKTIDLEPDNATFLDTYGWLLYLNGEYEASRRILKQAINYGGKSNAVMLDHYAEALYAVGEHDLAMLYWKDADKIDPSLGIAVKMKKRMEEKKQ